MKLYADLPAVRIRQLLTDALVVVWVYAWIRLARWLYDLVSKLAVPGRKLEGAGTGLADNLANAGRKVDRLPAVGDALSGPFAHAADAARSLATAGHDQQIVVHQLAVALAVAVLTVPLALVVFGWLPLRVRWMRRAGAAAALRRAGAGRDLLALRALANQPLRRLAALDPDIAAAWRHGDPAAVEALASLELRRLGLRG
ncbi:MAG TPA: hypothetical protein VGP31_09060 [Planosporangium sp.]|nr:hypothetical protein [Planosporangium sp.]